MRSMYRDCFSSFVFFGVFGYDVSPKVVITEGCVVVFGIEMWLEEEEEYIIYLQIYLHSTVCYVINKCRLCMVCAPYRLY